MAQTHTSIERLIPPIRLYELLHYEDWIIQVEDVNQSTRDIRFTIPSFGYVYVELETRL